MQPATLGDCRAGTGATSGAVALIIIGAVAAASQERRGPGAGGRTLAHAARLFGALLAALSLVACWSSDIALAVFPAEGQTLTNGAVVEGKCRSSVGQAIGVGEQWTLNTVDPQRARMSGGATLAPASLPPGLVPFGDFWTPGEALGEHGHTYQVSHDPKFSASWGWKYYDEWAWNLQGGSNTEQVGPGSGSSVICSPTHTVDTSGKNNPFPGIESYAGQFEGDSVVESSGLALKRPGQYALDQWRLEVQYVRVAAAEFAAHPFLPKACPDGTLIFTETASSEELRNVAGLEANYRVAGPPSEEVPNGNSTTERYDWVAQSYCLTVTATHFFVKGPPGKGAFSGDMSQWPSSPYINQYEAGARLGLPPGAKDTRPGAAASGPASLMMGMLDALGSSEPASWWPSLNDVYSRTVNAERSFDPAQGVKLLKERGWRQARVTPLPADQNSVADAGPPYPIVYPNPTNEAAIDKALQSGPVEVSTTFGTDEWGKTSGGHMILIVGIDPQQPGEYVVDDPAGNYFSTPTLHYRSGSYGYQVDYPKAWVLAYATNTIGRGFIAFGPHTGDLAVIDISDAEAGGPNAPTSFYLQNAAGQRAGWVTGEAVTEIPDSYAGEEVPWSQDVAGGDPEIEPTPEPEPIGPFPRFLSVPEPTTDLTLHVVGGSSGRYALSAEAGSGGSVVADEQLHGTSGSGQDTVVTSPALQSIAVPPPGGGETEGAGNASGGNISAGSGATGESGVASSASAHFSAAQIRALLAGEITPSGKSARIALLKKRGRFALRFRALEAGTAAVNWYELSHGAQLAKKTKAKPVLVAAGKLTFSAAGTQAMSIRLTTAGKRLLRRSKRLKLTAQGVFTPSGAAPVRATRPFTLRP